MKIPKQLFSLLSSKINEKNRYYILSGILLAIFLLNSVVLMMPQMRYLMWVNPKITSLKRDLKQVKENIKRLVQFESEVARLKDKMQAIGTTILSKEEIPTILDNISIVANESKVKINQMMPLKESQQLVLANEDGNYLSFPILVNIRGSYHNIGRFFNRIEYNKIFMSIIDFDITSTNDDPLRHSASVTIKAFVREKKESQETK